MSKNKTLGQRIFLGSKLPKNAAHTMVEKRLTTINLLDGKATNTLNIMETTWNSLIGEKLDIFYFR